MVIRKPLELPTDVARAFMDDMWAYFAGPNAIKRDEIALRQLHALKDQQAGADEDRQHRQEEKTAPPGGDKAGPGSRAVG